METKVVDISVVKDTGFVASIRNGRVQILELEVEPGASMQLRSVGLITGVISKMTDSGFEGVLKIYCHKKGAIKIWQAMKLKKLGESWEKLCWDKKNQSEVFIMKKLWEVMDKFSGTLRVEPSMNVYYKEVKIEGKAKEGDSIKFYGGRSDWGDEVVGDSYFTGVLTLKKDEDKWIGLRSIKDLKEDERVVRMLHGRVIEKISMIR